MFLKQDGHGEPCSLKVLYHVKPACLIAIMSALPTVADTERSQDTKLHCSRFKDSPFRKSLSDLWHLHLQVDRDISPLAWEMELWEMSFQTANS